MSGCYCVCVYIGGGEVEVERGGRGASSHDSGDNQAENTAGSGN